MKATSSEPLVLGVEDGSFPVNSERSPQFKTLLVAVLLRGLRIEEVRMSEITVDGTDATDAILDIARSLPTKPEVVMLAGISYGGFNFLDPFRLLKEASLPSIILTAEKPNNRRVKAALQHHFPDWRDRWSVYGKLSRFQSVKGNPKENPIFMVTVGILTGEAKKLLLQLTRIGRMPEPLRVARIIAHEITVEPLLKAINS